MLEIRKWRIKEKTALTKNKTKWNKIWQKSFGPRARMAGQRPCLVFLTSLKPEPLDPGFSHHIGARLRQVRTLGHRCPASVIKRSHVGLWLWPHHPFGCLLPSTVALEMESVGNNGTPVPRNFWPGFGQVPSGGFLWREEWSALCTPQCILYQVA